MLENILIEKCISEIERKLQWGKYSEWKHADFIKLSELIHKETGILLSVSSLKRIFGKIKSSHLPQIETRNALSRFIGFKDWEDYIDNTHIKEAIQKKSTTGKLIPLLIPIIIIAVVISFASLLLLQKKPMAISDYQVSLSTEISNSTAPQTVIFNYSIENIKDSVFIEYDDKFDAIQTEYLPPSNHTITHFYKLPDVYNIKVFTKKEVLKNLNLTLGADYWTAYYVDKNHNQYANILYPLNLNGSLSVSKSVILEQGIEIKSNPYNLEYRLIRDFNINLDHSITRFSTLQENPLNNLICYTIGISLIGDSTDFKVVFSTEDCYIKSLIKIGDYVEDGHFSDLSDLGLNFDGWKDFTIVFNQSSISIYYEENLITERDYFQNFNQLRGIVFHTSGNWKIDNIKVEDLETSQVFYNNPEKSDSPSL